MAKKKLSDKEAKNILRKWPERMFVSQTVVFLGYTIGYAKERGWGNE